MALDPLQTSFAEDLELASAAGRGDQRAARRLAERLFERVRTTVHYLAAGDRDADDMAQQALVSVLKAAGSYRGECRLERWADRIVVRTAMRQLKRRRFREQIVEISDDPPSRASADQEEQAARRQMRRRLSRLLTRLKPERRSVVILHWVHGYSIPEVAELTETPLNTVRDRLRTAKKQLRKSIMKDPVMKDWAIAMDHEHQS